MNTSLDFSVELWRNLVIKHLGEDAKKMATVRIDDTTSILKEKAKEYFLGEHTENDDEVIKNYKASIVETVNAIRKRFDLDIKQESRLMGELSFDLIGL